MGSLALLLAALLLEASVAFAPASAFLISPVSLLSVRAKHALPTAAPRLLLSSLRAGCGDLCVLCADRHEVMR